MDFTNTKILQELVTIAEKTPTYKKNEFIKALKIVDKKLRQNDFPYKEIIIRRCIAYSFHCHPIHHNLIGEIIPAIEKNCFYAGNDQKTFRAKNYMLKDLPISINENGLNAFIKYTTDQKSLKNIRQFIYHANTLRQDIDAKDGDSIFFENLDSMLMDRMLPA